MEGLAIDEYDKCFVVASDYSTRASLYSCNLSTGALTLIGSQTTGIEMYDISSLCNNTIYGYDNITKSIYTINKDNGAATLVGPVNVETNDMWSMTYDRDTSELYQYIKNNINNSINDPTTAFAQIDILTGRASLLSDFHRGTYVGAIKSTCGKENTLKITPGFNGSWYNPETGGQGFLIDVLPESNTFFMAWFTFDTSLPDPEVDSEIGNVGHRWLTAQGTLGEGNSVDLSIYSTFGGIFNNSATVTSEVVGTMKVSFENCSSGLIEFLFNNSGINGVIPIQRIANDNVALCEILSKPEK